MLADQSSRVFPVAARLRSKARRVGGHLYRQRRSFQNFICIDVGQGNLGSGDQIKTTLIGKLKQICLELRKLTGPEQRICGYNERWKHFPIAVSFGLEL